MLDSAGGVVTEGAEVPEGGDDEARTSNRSRKRKMLREASAAADEKDRELYLKEVQKFDKNEIESMLNNSEKTGRAVKRSKAKGIAASGNVVTGSGTNGDTPNEQEIHPAIKYLLLWLDKRNSWKFRKVRQTWLLQHMYDKTVISKANFKVLLKYLQDLKGRAKDATLEEAQAIVEAGTEGTKGRRARKVLKLLG